jgi:phage tail sheath protein FI
MSTYPGVYVEERPGGEHTIEGVTTSTSALVGYTPRGPVNEPRRVVSTAEYDRAFAAPGVASDLCSAIHLFFMNGGTEAYVVRVVGAEADAEGGADSSGIPPTAQDIIGDEMAGTGLHALDPVDVVNILCVPGCSDDSVIAAAQAYCEQRRAFLLIDVPAEDAASVTGAVAWIRDAATPKSANAAAYFPWLLIPDPLRQRELTATSPSGAIAGLYARTDRTRGVWTAPAGPDASLIGPIGLTCSLTDEQNSALNNAGFNTIRRFQDAGHVSWGARTLWGNDEPPSEWKYVPVRRTALFIEHSIERGTRWAVFEPNDTTLWSRLQRDVDDFMRRLFDEGAFVASSPRDAYFVTCDANTSDGVVTIVVGFAPLRPAEFVVIKVSQQAGLPPR